MFGAAQQTYISRGKITMNMNCKSWSRCIGILVALSAAVLMSACGGGGGDAGTPVFNNGGNGGTGGTTAAAFLMALEIRRVNVVTTQVSSSETVQAVATVTTRSGAPVSGVVVTFTETSVSLLNFQPQVGTALTDANGKATVDLLAKSPTGTGATTVSAAATIAGVAVSGDKSISITASATTAVPQPATISFVSSSSRGQAIVIKGAGGSGRAESAILEFRVLDASGAPINGADVDFSKNASSGGATISPERAKSDSSGRVTTTVLSGNAPASIVVTARSGSISVQSDTLLVSNSVPVLGSFTVVAAKYNLDGNLIGDSTKVSAFVGDENGNLVPDGVAVSFTTDYGAIGSSILGGCTTVNGRCDVDFRVQNPLGEGLATVIGTVRVGTSTTLTQSRQINMARASYIALREDGIAPLTTITMNSCKQTFQALLSDRQRRSVAAGTTIKVSLVSLSDVSVSIKNGTPVADRLDRFAPNEFAFEIDASADKLVPPCKVNGTLPPQPQLYFSFEFQTPGGTVSPQRVDVFYPR